MSPQLSRLGFIFDREQAVGGGRFGAGTRFGGFRLLPGTPLVIFKIIVVQRSPPQICL